MANFELKFFDANNTKDFIKVKKSHGLKLIKIELSGETIYLDKSTAIKFAKTLRTEINKIEEVNNG